MAGHSRGPAAAVAGSGGVGSARTRRVGDRSRTWNHGRSASVCDRPDPRRPVTRRSILAGGAALTAWAALAPARASAAHRLQTVEVAPGLDIVPRSSWGGDLLPQGPLPPEAPGDVRFLLVHHTASPNGYGASDVVGQLRGFYEFHTGEKAWPDVAYNFFVDSFGVVYEARTGSLEAPIKGDATGGSQGFALLCCFVGDLTATPPTLAATTSMVKLLAWLADGYGIDTSPGATTTFVSRGSNLHPAGTEVTAATISGHRDMSQTSCPGDACYPIVRNDFPRLVTTRRAEVAAPPPPTTAPPPRPTTAPPTSSTPAPPTSEVAQAAPPPGDDGSPTDALPIALGVGGAVAAGTAGYLLWDGRRPDGGQGEEP